MRSKRTTAAVYMDHAAATPLDERVLAAMRPYFSTRFYNPSAIYGAAQAVASDMAAARASIAVCLGAKPAEIIFTAGATEANNLAVQGIMNLHPGCNLVVSAIEHESILRPAAQYVCRQARVDHEGVIDLADLESKIDDDTVLVSVMYANNEVGTIQPLRDVVRLVTAVRRQRRSRGDGRPLYLHTDAAQAANYLDLHVSRLGIDLMSVNGGKIYGPKQSGLLYIRAGTRLEPLIYGGGQERGLRSGTENTPGIAGLAKALELAQAEHQTQRTRLLALRQQFEARLMELLPTATVNGSPCKRLPNNIHVTVPGHDNERLLMSLDAAGILAAAGSACSASDAEPSHVLRAMGLDDAAARASLRFTMGRGTSADDVERTVRALARAVVS